MKIIPALLTEEWDTFAARLRQAESFADYVQIDMMDGLFVPTSSFDPGRLNGVETGLKFEVHLMVNDPMAFVRMIESAGVKRMVFHIEAATDPGDTARRIRERGMEAGIAVRPGTSVEEVAEIVAEFSHVLFLTVDPGRYGSPFKPEVLKKVSAARKIFAGRTIGVDGGVSLENLADIHRAGADSAVVGSRIFLEGDPAGNYRRFVEAADDIERRQQRADAPGKPG
jgi:ribulose-phosphate 3-epimerase